MAVRQIAAPVAGAIQTVRRVAGEWVGQVALSAEIFITQVAWRQVRTADIDLPRLPDPGQAACLVQQEELNAFAAPSERHHGIGGALRRLEAGRHDEET